MKILSYFYFIIFIISFNSCGTEKSDPVEKTRYVADDLESRIAVGNVPSSIISLAPNLTEFIYALDLQDKLIGNTLYCNFPEEAKNIAKVGDLLTIDLEKIVTLNPDIIFITVEGNTKDNYTKLKELGYTVFVSNPRNFEGIKKTTMDLASIFGLKESAKDKIEIWQSRLDAVYEESRDKPKTKAMFLVSINPIVLAAKNTFVNGFLEVCNLENITGDVEINYPFFNREDILERDPQIIIHTSENISSQEDLIKAYPEWSSLDAVKNRRVYYADPDLFHRPGPRFAEAAETLYNTIYGD